GRTDAVSAHVHHVIDPAGDPVITVLIATGAIAGEVGAGNVAEVGLDEALVVAVHCTRLARPRIRQNQRALAGPFDRCTVRSYQRRTNAEERRARGPGFLRPGSGEGRQNEAAGLRLPPC